MFGSVRPMRKVTPGVARRAYRLPLIMMATVAMNPATSRRDPIQLQDDADYGFGTHSASRRMAVTPGDAAKLFAGLSLPMA
jgi:hypothetical protein